MATTRNRLKCGLSLTLSITALPTEPTGFWAARPSTLVMRLKCNSTHIMIAPATSAMPAQP